MIFRTPLSRLSFSRQRRYFIADERRTAPISSRFEEAQVVGAEMGEHNLAHSLVWECEGGLKQKYAVYFTFYPIFSKVFRKLSQIVRFGKLETLFVIKLKIKCNSRQSSIYNRVKVTY